MLGPIFANQFKKDLRLMAKRHKNMDKIYELITDIIGEVPLPDKYGEHELSGTYAGYTECHIEGDWILIYRFPGDNTVHFSRTGTHSDLF
ncbi:hypothetical protein AGMMS50268_30750 [Spirochaetia bacterium]|nr:hypothetical protein AGMMS50268_30750 [Spirochaetia bacterium]